MTNCSTSASPALFCYLVDWVVVLDPKSEFDEHTKDQSKVFFFERFTGQAIISVARLVSTVMDSAVVLVIHQGKTQI
ncbi:hypothetical protein BO71DRAFT_429041 [Aspergillus ellipticus CBS 707.79]|uniref:Uncharacterized protein n=1 Tax=Aspergillus ellipticus CBS 707.79 TaxID=1448320 RepID=A0A319DDP9_9EURO|nr:hypothetical protein BO71DRAFT_429041 [Aspergillus ellipticus CBS 707.79]